MNENDMARYFWRTGQRWNGENRPLRRSTGLRLPGRTILLLLLSFLVTLAVLVALR